MPSTAQLTPEQRAAIRLVLAETVTATGRAHRRIGWSRGLAIIGSGVLTAGVAVVVALGAAQPPAGGPEQSASSVLEKAAAAVRDEPVVQPGQYLVVRTRADYLAISSLGGDEYTAYVAPEIEETFHPYRHDEPTVRRTTYLRPTVFYGAGAEEQAARDWAGQKDKVVVKRGPQPPVPELGGGTAPPPLDPGTLPLEPAELLAFLRSHLLAVSMPPDENAFRQALELLKPGDAPPPVRTALYQALALIPAVTITGRTSVLGGAEGTTLALTTDAGAGRQEIVIDPVSGQYLGERAITVHGFGAIPAGTVMESTSVTLSVVDQAP